MPPPKTPSPKRSAMSLTICSSICACALVCSACATDSTPSTRAVIDAQGVLLDAGPIVCPNGADVTPHGQPATYRFTGRVYVLPEPAYRALMLAD